MHQIKLKLCLQVRGSEGRGLRVRAVLEQGPVRAESVQAGSEVRAGPPGVPHARAQTLPAVPVW